MTGTRLAGTLVACLLLGCIASDAAARTREAVLARGTLPCGVVVEQEDFTKADTHGDLSGFSSAICGAVAAAVVGDASKVRLQGFPDDAHGIAALRAGGIALLVGTTPEATSALLNRLRFSPTLFVDGQGFLVRRDLHARTPADLRGKLVCYLSETPADVGLQEWAAHVHVAVRPHPFEETGEMEAALTTGNCDAVTAGVSLLADMRSGFHGKRGDFEILPQTITFDPYAAATRDDDPAWTTIVSDVVTALIEAEQDGIGHANLEAMGRGSDPAAQRLLGPTPGLASLLGLKDGWATRAIGASGNYGEILTATTGPGSALNLPRGKNALWTDGGLIGTPSGP